VAVAPTPEDRTPDAKRNSSLSHNSSGRAPTVIVGVITVAIVGLSLWYLKQPQPLLVQGEADATRIDISARVDGRIGKLLVVRGENVDTGARLVEIENPELIAKYHEAEAAKTVADAGLSRIQAGTRAEIIATRQAEIDRAAANVTLARQTYDRLKQLVADKYATQQKLDEATDALQVAQRGYDQARLGYQEAAAGFTPEERQIAEGNVVAAEARVATFKALVDQMTITAPAATQVYQINIEDGEFVLPGIPLISLVDLDDVWLRFDLREDLIKNVKIGDRITVRAPALGNRTIAAEIKLIAAKGEYAGWRATRATGDFDLRTFQIRAYPIERIPGLRPGMSVYTDWSSD
jgi:HlyD family secretion protein